MLENASLCASMIRGVSVKGSQLISWERRGESVTGWITSRQVLWLRQHLSDHLCRLDEAIRTGVGDPVIAAVLAASRAVEPNAVRVGLADSRATVAAALESLADHSGVIELRTDEARWRWVWALHELRIAVGVRLGGNVHAPAAAGLMVWLERLVDEVVNLMEFPLDLGASPDQRKPAQ